MRAAAALCAGAALSWAAVEGLAGDWHNSASTSLICSDCHTMHFSEEGGIPTRGEAGGPWKRLLLQQTVNGLCLSCHDGWNPNAPDVLTPVSTAYAPAEHSGAGFFVSPGTINANGHNLGVAADGGTAPPMAGGVTWTVPAGGLSCVQCHNPHGNTNYRNLQLDPNGDSVSSTLTSSNPAVATDQVFQAVYADGANPAAVYRRSNIGYRSGYAAWCAECHGALFPNTPGVAPAHFQRHPLDVAINAAGNHTDQANWIAVTPNGVGATTGDGLFGIPRVRFQSPAATTYAAATTVAADNQVFCASCHLVHGSAYDSGLVWPYRETPAQADTYAACEQCHNK